VLRLKKRLGMQSGEFLREYAQICVDKQLPIPSLSLRPNDETGVCRFLGEQGCTVYSDRPWACRLYPLGFAVRKDPASGQEERRYFLVPQQEACCRFETPGQTVRQWLDTQETEAYERWGAQFKELVLHDGMKRPEGLSPMKTEMWFTACYDLDRFREFVFGSTLLDRFEVEDDLVEEMRYDDEGLMRFAIQWLRFSLLGEQTVQMRTSAVEAYIARASHSNGQPASEPE
jgi:Fe-S-cluster containining protein